MINLPAHPPSWLLVEWQEDLESAAVDLGQAFAVDDEGDSKATFVAQENFARRMGTRDAGRVTCLTCSKPITPALGACLNCGSIIPPPPKPKKPKQKEK
jgi:hypothetical protein